jgi:hypothetical protein
MNLQAGTTVGFTTALGALGGGLFGAIMAGLLEVKRPEPIAIGLAAAGGLIGAFMGGVIVGPDTSSTTAGATGASGVPARIQVKKPAQLGQ